MATLSTERRIDVDGRVRIPAPLLPPFDVEAVEEVLLQFRDGTVVFRALVAEMVITPAISTVCR